jgi:hypothetical protein
MDGRKHTIFEAGGKVYNLRVSFNAMCMFDDQIGPVTALLSGGAEAKNFIAYRGLLWASINAYGSEKITVEQAGDICEQYIAEKGFEAFVKEMQRIIQSSEWLGDKKGDAGKNSSPDLKKPSGKS